MKILKTTKLIKWARAFAFYVLIGGASQLVADKPNVLFIAIDDMNDWAGYLEGHPQVKTPSLDRFAKESLVFRNAHCAAPICNPSRTAVMSGLSPHTSGIYLNGRGHDWKNSSVLTEVETLPELFKRSGYYTLWVGKIFHTRPDEEVMARMWDDQENADGGYGPRALTRHIPKAASRFKNFDWDEWKQPDDEFADVRNTRKVIDFLKRKHDKPFFAAMGFYRPHNPWTAPKRYFEPFPMDEVLTPEMADNDLKDIPEAAIRIRDSAAVHEELVKVGQDKAIVRAYLASIYFMDDLLGQILDALESSAYVDNTIVVLWSDHGYNHGQKDIWGKSALWEQTTRCVMMINAPGANANGASVTAPVNLIDMYPTLVDICGLRQPKQALDGLSLSPFLADSKHRRVEPSLTWYGAENVAVRSERYRLIRYFDGSLELYDHQSDPNEWRNLADDSQYEELVAKLQSAIPEQPAAPVGKRPLGLEP